MKKLCLILLLLTVLVGCAKETTSNQEIEPTEAVGGIDEAEGEEKAEAEATAEPKATIEPLSADEISKRTAELTASFLQQYSLDASQLAEPLLYDITNDGLDEVILYSKKDFWDDVLNYYIGIYSLSEEKALFTSEYEAMQGLVVEPIVNPTYNKALAVLDVSFGASGGSYTAKVFVNDKNKITTLNEFWISMSDDIENYIRDVDADGFDEFVGSDFEGYLVPGSDRLSNADQNRIVLQYEWNEDSSTYELANVPGISSEPLLKPQALQLIQIARNVLSSWSTPIGSEEQVKEILTPVYSNNFIYELLMLEGAFYVEQYQGYVTSYSEYGDIGWILPEFTQNAKLSIDEDGKYASLDETLEIYYEGMSEKRRSIVRFANTNEGWKIDQYESKYIE